MERSIKYDIARSLSILWITVVFHLSAYLGEEYNLNDVLACNDITWAALGCFSLISGLFIGRKEISKLSEVWPFYKKRLVRIYPLFFISALALWIIGYNGFAETIHGLLGISSFSGKQPMTLWYISMILFFYLITPTLLNKKLNRRIVISLGYLVMFGILYGGGIVISDSFSISFVMPLGYA